MPVPKSGDGLVLAGAPKTATQENKTAIQEKTLASPM